MHGCVFASVLISCLFSIQVQSQTQSEAAKNTTTEQGTTKPQTSADLDRWLLAAYEGDPEAQYKVGKLYSDSKLNKPDHQQYSIPSVQEHLAPNQLSH